MSQNRGGLFAKNAERATLPSRAEFEKLQKRIAEQLNADVKFKPSADSLPAAPPPVPPRRR